MLTGMALTEKQQRAWDLSQSGKTIVEIARECGVSGPVISKILKVCRKKLGITPVESKKAASQRRELQNTNPEEFAARLDAATDPALIKLQDALEDAGIKGKAAQAFVARLRRRFPGVAKEAKALKTAAMADLMNQKIVAALEAMDDCVIQEASFRDLALGSTALIEKMQLLKGQPTAITSDLERKKLVELTPLLIAEAQRRGITIDGTATVVQEAA